MYPGIDEDDGDTEHGTPDNTMNDSMSGDDGEPDGDAPQEPAHSSLTVPKHGMAKTNESLSLLGAGQPYINRNK